MDINSNEAHYLAGLFMRGRMQAVVNREAEPPILDSFVNMQDRQVFMWTNQNRIIRVDAPHNQINALSRNRQHFEPIAALADGEMPHMGRPMGREDLLPTPSMMWRMGTAVAPYLGSVVGVTIVSGMAHVGISILAGGIAQAGSGIWHLASIAS